MQAPVDINVDLSQRIRDLVDYTGNSYSEFSSIIGIPKNSLSRYVNGKSAPGSSFWIAVKQNFPRVDLNEYIGGVRSFGESQPGLVSDKIEPYGASNKLRLRVYVANAGDTIELEGYEDFFDLDIVTEYPSPEEWGRASFYIQGDSMSPTLEQGEVVMADRVYDPAQFEDGGVYMVQTGGQLLCKRVYLDENDKTLLVLVSDNTVHRDKRVERDGARLWKLKHRITGKGLGGL